MPCGSRSFVNKRYKIGSVEIVQDMFLKKTLLGVFAVPKREGQTGEDKKNLRIFCRSIKKGRIQKLFPKE